MRDRKQLLRIDFQDPKIHTEQNEFRGQGHHGGRRGRLFEAGRMKLLVLYLIQQAPKHGYEIIKEISDLVGGDYIPSAGTIYPTLTYLEDMTFISIENIEAERKQYKITEAGLEHLKQQQEMIQVLLEKLKMKREIHSNDDLIDIHRALENLKTALGLKLKSNAVDPNKVRLIADKIDQVAVEIARL